MSEQKVFQYVQFKSLVSPDFWYKLAEVKLDDEKLNEDEKEISGSFSNFNTKNCLIELDCTAFNSHFSVSKNNFPCHGILRNLNTVESFKACDKNHLLKREGERLLKNITDGSCIKDPSKLVTFVLLSYADLKKYNFYYWFAFPTSIEPVLYESSQSQIISEKFSDDKIQLFGDNYQKIDQKQATFFIADENFNIIILRDILKHDAIEDNLKNVEVCKIYFCFSDPSEYENPGWMLRNYMLFLYKLCPMLHEKQIKVLSIRQDEKLSLKPSRLYTINIPPSFVKLDESTIKWTGWEKNNQGKLLPRIASMSETMDPIKVSEHFSMLNLKLMKWRLLPELNLDIIKNQKCLLFGAGTLGCAIARSLISWGIIKITFIDYGHVSYSNPVRQSLFTHADAAQNKFKAKAAAERLSEVLPSVQSSGHVLQVPMPGHTLGESMKDKTLENIHSIVDLIKEHDVLFLITDSRESRWLPTHLGAFYGKTVITSALGFDSYLVMRHGSRTAQNCYGDVNVDGLKCISGDMLGCYFCNDVTAPGNSMRDRTLDQQCTVTRPGVSNIAASIAVELLVSLLQHEKKNLAPAYYQASNKDRDNVSLPEGILGVVPHSVRGYLSTYSHILPATEKFSQCIACSERVLKEYEKHGDEFLLKVFNSAEYLEIVTGISEMANMEHDIIEDFDEESD